MGILELAVGTTVLSAVAVPAGIVAAIYFGGKKVKALVTKKKESTESKD